MVSMAFCVYVETSAGFDRARTRAETAEDNKRLWIPVVSEEFKIRRFLDLPDYASSVCVCVCV